MKTRWLVALTIIVLLPSLAGAAPQQKTKVYITWTAQTTTPKKAGAVMSAAEGTAALMETWLASMLAELSPCLDILASADVRTLLGHEKDRQLLGAGSGNDVLATVADNMNAQYVIHINVAELPGKFTMNVVAVDARTKKTIAHGTQIISADDADALEALLKSTADSFIAALPACRERWTGTVSVDMTFDKAENNFLKVPDGTGSVNTSTRTTWSFNGKIAVGTGTDLSRSDITYAYKFKFVRDVKAEQKKPGCSGNSHDSGTRTDEASGVRPTSVDVAREAGQLRIVLGGIEGMAGKEHEVSSTESSASGPDCGGSGSQSQSWDRAGIDRISFDVDYLIPIAKDADRISYSWSDEKFGIKRTFTVNLTRKWK